jgi:hypothetical protein
MAIKKGSKRKAFPKTGQDERIRKDVKKGDKKDGR